MVLYMLYAVVNLPEGGKKKRYIRAKNPNIYHCGDNGGEVPPVPIPNTEVKLVRAEDTLPDTARENRSSLHPKLGYRALCGIRAVA